MHKYLWVLAALLLFSCKKYKDPNPFTDPRIVSPYCNDPSAVNYNWDFPGKPDNSVCIYPTDVIQGAYFYHDTIYNSTGDVIKRDSFTLNFSKIDTVHFTIQGFCTGTQSISARATRYLLFSIDSLLGNGQEYCGLDDTIMGKGKKYSIESSAPIKLEYQIQTDSGMVFHYGTAIKL
ncbi:MAG: hypothetical protein R2831_11295 [Chitinophagaceae bacterium]